MAARRKTVTVPKSLYEIRPGWLSRVPYEPHPGQCLLHWNSSEARFAFCSRRWGKDEWGVQEVSRLLQLWMDDVEFAKPAHIIPRIHVWFLSPIYSLSRDWERRFRRVWPHSFEYNKSERIYQLPNDMLVEFKTGERPDSLVSAGLDLLPSTEMQAMQAEAWEQVEPTLVSPWRYGLRIGTGIPWPNPKMEQIKNYADNGAEDMFYLTRPSADNPHIDRVRLQREIDRTPHFLQGPMYLGQWPSSEGAVFRKLDVACQIPPPSPDFPMYSPASTWTVYAGLDPARLMDFMVLAILEKRKDGRAHMIALDRFNKEDWQLQVERVGALLGRYRSFAGKLDGTGIGDPVLSMFDQMGLDFEPVNFLTDKDRLIRQLVLAFDHDKIRVFNHELVRDELRLYRATKTASGRISYSAPSGLHDDIVCAIALAYDAVLHGATALTPEQKRQITAAMA